MSATKMNRLMLFKEAIAVYCEDNNEYMNELYWHNVQLYYVKVDRAYNNH
jgi:hypothetical protein